MTFEGWQTNLPTKQKRTSMSKILNAGALFVKETSLQTVILTTKNMILYWRRWKSTLVQLLAPFVVILLLFILTKIIETKPPEQFLNPKDVPFQRKLARCFKKFSKTCVTIRYTTNGNAFAKDVMDRVLETQSHIPTSEIVESISEASMLNEFNAVKNATLYAVSFSPNTDYYQTMLPVLGVTPGIVGTNYVIYINGTSDTIVHETFALQTLIDNAIATLRLGLTNTEIFDPVYNEWPLPPDPQDGQLQVFGIVGPQFFSICAMIILVISLYSLVVEKEKRLRFGMKMMGLRDSAYYISWFLSFTVMCFLASLVSVFSGMMFQIVMFLKTNWFVIFAMFFTFGMCLVCLAFLLSTIVNTGKAALILGFVILAISFILNLVSSSNHTQYEYSAVLTNIIQFVANGAAVYRLYGDQISKALPVLLSLYPPYNFARIFADISYQTLPQYDKFQRVFKPGPGYKWGDLYRHIDYYEQKVPPTHFSFYILLGESLVFLVLAWYLDNVLPGATGIARKPWFFLQPSFYGIRFAKSNNDFSKWKQPELEKLPKDDPLRREYDDVRDASIPFALRLVGLRKVYDRLFGLLKSHEALKGLNLGVLPGTCIAFLGHNGAGKSTTMNILTGLINSSGGEALIFGKDVRTDVDLIRKRIGVCPQHDILWDDLTALEHLYIFGLFKDVPLKELRKMSDYLLSKVNLTKVASNTSGTYSGGMKRRLSVAIACIGDPELILLDEPTTGMDPFSRRQVWDLIEEMKGGKKSESQTSRERVILLTTHSMDEADALSDRISIVANGELQAIGDSLSLKKQYGEGYSLTLVAYAGRADEVEKMAVDNLPKDSQPVSNNAGSFIYQIPTHRVEELGTFLEILEQEAQKDNSALKDWGIAHTTLEQVYLIVTEIAEGHAKPKQAVSDDEEPNGDVELKEVEVRGE